MSEPVWKLKTRTGLSIDVRPVRPDDRLVLSDLFQHLRKEDLGFRFLSAINDVGPEWIGKMTQVDRDRIKTYPAFDRSNNIAVATAMLARDADNASGEVAISVHADYRHRGIGWEFLAFVADQDRLRGMRRI